jgi:hypothetical protein
MSTAFDASAIERHGWRQGAVLGHKLADEARKLAPRRGHPADPADRQDRRRPRHDRDGARVADARSDSEGRILDGFAIYRQIGGRTRPRRAFAGPSTASPRC